MGHDVLSDFADRSASDPLLGLYKNCGFWTHDEAAILYTCAMLMGGRWIDIGCHTMWTTAHIAAAGCDVLGIDPMLPVPEFAARAAENKLGLPQENRRRINAIGATSKTAFALLGEEKASGIVVDGDHCHPCPLEDAESARKHLEETGFVLFHDFIGRPVREGVEYLMACGFKCKVYWTPHMVACCWRGDIAPPHHTPDPQINWEAVKSSMPDFDFARCA